MRAYLLHGDGRLVIYSRRGTKRQILVAILSVPAAPSLHLESTVARGPSKAERHRLEPFIEPFVERILADLTPTPKPSPQPRIPWWPIRFPHDAA